MYTGNEKTLRGIKTTDGMTDIVISAITAWQTNPNGDLQIFLLGDTIFTVIAEQDSVVARLRIVVG
jgi:hypothetical protein